MKPLRDALILIVLAAALPVRAFHDGGVASCTMCHIMHNGSDGFALPPTIANNYLLRFDSPTDVCLSCHASNNGSVWANSPWLPTPEHGGGNFVFGNAPNLNDSPDGAMVPLVGSHGVHNCSNNTFGMGEDPIHATAPGGNYPAMSLSCTSCHDPHGNTNFRMLRGVGFVAAGDFNFIYPAPIAEGIELNGPPESSANHTAYQSGWTNWCANCHGLYHTNIGIGFEHPVTGTMNIEVASSYAYYNGTSDPTGGNPLTSYLPQVPFQDPLFTTSSSQGPLKRSEIACITCHRAHGSSAVDIGRWDFQVTDLRQDGFPSGSYALPVPYGGTVERSLCVKCHEQDTRTHGFDQPCLSCHREGLEFEPTELLRMPAQKSR